MKAAFLTRGGMVLRDRPRPKAGRGEVVVRFAGIGVCTGDLEAWRRRESMEPGLEAPIGHEASGTVVEVGPGVRGFARGDRVTVMGGHYQQFEALREADLARLPDGVDLLWALGEPMACCVHACNRSGIRLGDRVAVVGCGFMGLMCMQISLAQRAGEVVAVDPVAWRRQTARKLGAARALSPEQASDEAPDWHHGCYDVVIEAAGTGPALDLCGRLVRQHGCINIVGYHQSREGLRTIDMKQWNYKALTVVNGHIRRIDEKLAAMRAGVDLLAAGRVTAKPLVTAYPLAQAERAFQDLHAMKKGLFKAVLVP